MTKVKLKKAPIYVVIEKEGEKIDECDDGLEPVFVAKIWQWNFWYDDKIGIYQFHAVLEGEKTDDRKHNDRSIK